MKPFIQYNLLRLGLFAIALGLVWFLPLGLLAQLMLAIVASGVASLFLLKRVRDRVAEDLSTGVQRRRAERDRLRSALAGDDERPPVE